MDFLDTNLTKSSSLLLHAIRSPLYCTVRFQRKPYSFLVFKILTKKSAKQENSSLFMNIILKNEKMRVENRKKLESENTRVYAQKPRQKMPLKNSIS
jgi:hypothetical protein